MSISPCTMSTFEPAVVASGVLCCDTMGPNSSWNCRCPRICFWGFGGMGFIFSDRNKVQLFLFIIHTFSMKRGFTAWRANPCCETPLQWPFPSSLSATNFRNIISVFIIIVNVISDLAKSQHWAFGVSLFTVKLTRFIQLTLPLWMRTGNCSWRSYGTLVERACLFWAVVFPADILQCFNQGSSRDEAANLRENHCRSWGRDDPSVVFQFYLSQGKPFSPLDSSISEESPKTLYVTPCSLKRAWGVGTVCWIRRYLQCSPRIRLVCTYIYCLSVTETTTKTTTIIIGQHGSFRANR